MKKITPYFESLISKKGFSVVVWSKAGWINFFSTKPVVYPKDLKPQKLCVAEGDAELLQAWRSMGYNAIPLATNDLMTRPAERHGRGLLRAAPRCGIFPVVRHSKEHVQRQKSLLLSAGS